jgi:hypothetical protein
LGFLVKMCKSYIFLYKMDSKSKDKGVGVGVDKVPVYRGRDAYKLEPGELEFYRGRKEDEERRERRRKKEEEMAGVM